MLFSGEYRNFADCLSTGVAKGYSFAGADLRNANLANVELDGGHFAGADFSGANLSGANVSEADLRGCYFNNSDMSYAQFDGALFGATEIAGTTLIECEFSTLSAFSLAFDEADMVLDCRFINSCDTVCPFSRQPLVIRGLSAAIYILDRHIKIGHLVFPLEDIPAWIASGTLNPRNLRMRLEQVLLALIMDDKRPKIA